MTKTELKQKAETYRTLVATTAIEGTRGKYLRRARNFYAELGVTRLVQWIDRFLKDGDATARVYLSLFFAEPAAANLEAFIAEPTDASFEAFIAEHFSK